MDDLLTTLLGVGIIAAALSLNGCGELYIGHSYYGKQHHDRRDVSEDSQLDNETPRAYPSRYERQAKQGS